MAEINKKMKEESDLVYEIMGGKKTKKVTDTKDVPVPKEEKGEEDDNLEMEILTGKTIKPAKVTKLSKEDQEDVDLVTDLFGSGKKKKKSEPAAETGEKKPGKKFDREEYFGL